MNDADLWDREAKTFDDAPDHGLLDQECRDAWRTLLLRYLPPAPARVADLGCGTGTLALLLAEDGYAVDGVDFSPEMVRRARSKAGHVATFVEGDAAEPPLPPASYDVVLCRHVLWALPSPLAVLERWIRLLDPTGRLLMVEGNWSIGAGLSAEKTLDLVRHTGRNATLRRLPEPVFWGREITDDSYLVVST